MNGQWDFAFDDENIGVLEGWSHTVRGDRKINVPFTYETGKSGIGDERPHGVIWYWKNITITNEFKKDQSIQINFEGCDYHLDLWVNGVYKGSHDGAYTRFAFELGKFAEGEEVLLSIRVEDPHSEEQVRGKQRWLSDNYGCWYVQTTGIWKDVWLEQVSDDYVEKIKITPDIYKKTVTIHTMCHSNKENLIMKSDVYFEGKFINSVSGKLEAGVCQMDIDVYNKYVGEWGIELWSPDAPNLYTLKISILDEDDNCKDEVESYFGMRDIRIRNGLVLLNGQPLYQRLVLDQGYWKDTGLTPENDDVLLKDIEYVVPIIFSIVMSFYNYNGFPGAPFVGLANYKMLFQDPEFLGALKNTVVFVLVAVVLNICISTFLAVLIKSLRKKGARSFFRGWMFLPAVVPIVAVCYVWLIMFDPANGVLNQALMALGMDHPINWLNDPRTALFSIVLVTLWCDLGYNLVILMSGLDNIPNMFLEAAEIDGANSIQKFFKITLPLMSRNMLFVVIMTCISYFQVFAQVQIMTQGGPENHTNVIGLNIYNYAFRYSQMGYASAMAVVLLGIILIVSLVQLKVGKQDWEY